MITEEIYEQNKDYVLVDGMTLEGPFFHRSMLEKIGFVEKNFFIYADDTEYSIRLLKNNIKMAIIKDAKINRLLPFPTNVHIFD